MWVSVSLRKKRKKEVKDGLAHRTAEITACIQMVICSMTHAN